MALILEINGQLEVLVSSTMKKERLYGISYINVVNNVFTITTSDISFYVWFSQTFLKFLRIDEIASNKVIYLLNLSFLIHHITRKKILVLYINK